MKKVAGFIGISMISIAAIVLLVMAWITGVPEGVLITGLIGLVLCIIGYA